MRLRLLGLARCMPSHLSSIGFRVESEDDFGAIAERAAELAEPIKTKAGSYLRWRGASGAELWLQVDRSGDLVGMNPHFGGSARVRVSVESRVPRPSDTPLDGAFQAWVEPKAGVANRVYPLVFDCPNSASYAEAPVPGVGQAQLAAFAHEIEVHATRTAFDRAQAKREVKLDALSFIPAGLFRGGKQNPEPQATAVLSGIVRSSKTLKNEISGSPFHWARIESYAAEYDVVIDPDLAALPPVGGIVSGFFWLSGTLINYPEAGKSKGPRRIVR